MGHPLHLSMREYELDLVDKYIQCMRRQEQLQRMILQLLLVEQ